jgi:acetyl-CoA synthetase
VEAVEGYDAIRAAFAWRVPARFNAGVACSDAHRHDAPAVVAGTETLTFGGLSELSNRFANALAGLGLGRGDRVAFVLPQGFTAAICHVGAYKAGAVAVPMSELFGPDAIRHRLGDSGSRVVVCGAAVVDVVAEAAADLGVRVVRDGDELEHLLASSSPRFDPVDTAAGEPAFLIYTSGTTAAPKGCLHAHRCLLGHLPGFDLSHGFFPQDGDRFWTPADWAWMGGLMDGLIPSLFHGRPIVANPAGRFDPEAAARLVVEQGVRNTFLPPTALRFMRNAGVSLPPGTLRTAMSGGEVLGADTLEWARDALGVTVAETYGQTEANYVIGNSPGAWPVRPGSMGRAYPGHEVEVIDAEGNPLEPGEEGEVAVRVPDPVAFLGYLNAPEATRDKHVGDWLRTGDVARRDEDGYFWFAGRADDLIISSGYRIAPVEIEQCLARHPAVAAVAVVGVPDEARGQVVKAFVVARDGCEPGDRLAGELQEHVRSRLAAYEYPRQVEFVPELPLTVTGKVRRRALLDG